MAQPSIPESISGSGPLAPEPAKSAAGENNGDKIPRSRGAEILILLIGSGLLVLTSFIVVNFLTARSRDAVINATPIAIRTPITGTLQSLPVKTGEAVELNQELAVIRNTSASREELEQISTEHLAARSRQADLRRQVQAQRQLVAVVEGDAGRQQELEQRRNRHDLGQTMADLQRARAELAAASHGVV